MNRMEKAALSHAAEWLRYSRSPQAKLDFQVDVRRREALTRKQGHIPQCGILKCHPDCPSLRCD
jgi:hypothetical protein